MFNGGNDVTNTNGTLGTSKSVSKSPPKHHLL